MNRKCKNTDTNGLFNDIVSFFVRFLKDAKKILVRSISWICNFSIIKLKIVPKVCKTVTEKTTA